MLDEQVTTRSPIDSQLVAIVGFPFLMNQLVLVRREGASMCSADVVLDDCGWPRLGIPSGL